MTQTAKIFTNGRSQAVRLPAAFRFDTKEVFIRQDPTTGDVILSRKPASWDGFFAALRRLPCDLALIDTAAGVQAFCRTLLAASDSILIPQQAEPLGLRSLPTLLQTLVRLRERGAGFEVAGILLTMVQPGVGESESAVADLRHLAPPELVLRTTVEYEAARKAVC